jgi:hypothetical protein
MMKTKPFAFFFHYNKPLSQSWGRNILSIHYKGYCHFVEGLKCNVPIATRNRKSQPRCVMAGKASEIKITCINGFNHAIIN